LTSRYKYRNLDDEAALCRDDKISSIRKVSKLVFDCDGVIVSDRNSYRQAIVRSVDHYFLRLMELRGNEGRLVTQEDIQKMKNTGAFNNDWALTYALIIYFLGLIIRRLPSEVTLSAGSEISEMKNPEHIRILSDKLRSVGERLEQLGIDIEYLTRLKSDTRFGLKRLLGSLTGKTDLSSLREIGLFLGLKDLELEAAKMLCPFSVDKDDLLRRLFDEIYLGKTLYAQFSGREPFFAFPEGLIDKEERIPSTETLERLKLRFGLSAMYSERPRMEGYYILQKHRLLSYFDKEAMLFSEDIMKPSGSASSDSSWGKPDARAFVGLLKRFSRNDEIVAYVGDTVSDALMVMNARGLDARELLFIGILSSSPSEADLQREFLDLGAEVIVKDVNVIPTVFDRIGK